MNHRERERERESGLIQTGQIGPELVPVLVLPGLPSSLAGTGRLHSSPAVLWSHTTGTGPLPDGPDQTGGGASAHHNKKHIVINSQHYIRLINKPVDYDVAVKCTLWIIFYFEKSDLQQASFQGTPYLDVLVAK